MELKLHKEFRIDFDRGFIECVNFQNQNRPNIEVLQLLFDLDLLDQVKGQQSMDSFNRIMANDLKKRATALWLIWISLSKIWVFTEPSIPTVR